MIIVGREDRAMLESNLSARPMAGNSREQPALPAVPVPQMSRLFLAQKR